MGDSATSSRARDWSQVIIDETVPLWHAFEAETAVRHLHVLLRDSSYGRALLQSGQWVYKVEL